MISHAPPGVLTEFGHALRAPCGRIYLGRYGEFGHGARFGSMGRSGLGERAAAEVMAADSVVPA